MMKRHWLLVGSCLLLIAALFGALTWTQHRQTAVQPATTSTKVHASSQANRVATKQSTQPAPWHQLKHPLRLPILMYHSISTGNQLRVPAKQFRQEMAYLTTHHYRTLTTQEAIRALKTNSVPQKKVVWITLDDAYKDNLTRALPVLQANRQHATINAITGFTHKANHLSLAEMTRMQATGRIDFQSHTVRHLDLNSLSAAQQQRELVNSKAWLDQHLHQTTPMLCYPAGRADATTRRLAKQAGYEIALTTQEGYAQYRKQGRYNLARLRITPGMTTASFANLLAGANA